LFESPENPICERQILEDGDFEKHRGLISSTTRRSLARPREGIFVSGRGGRIGTLFDATARMVDRSVYPP